jgi:hypothetical protein
VVSVVAWQADVVVGLSAWKYAISNKTDTELKAAIANFGPLSVCVATGGWQVHEFHCSICKYTRTVYVSLL